ncbi:Rne/Rng family ribonuclease [Anaerotignum sp. MSJ-24]|uniref:Rne/Rng family ribonuclease n=1 Tax=Anaerotignum sp. MSJ-24 TaxID=2841521 RepID=UPI001C0FD704|nr:Rne/Rng family ribonuclease [Anaerotignum sp. MSJ-24]MBU5464412.1 Rne/Rng family ribonuclease [Anaerotignum sp. MSJ-24]
MNRILVDETSYGTRIGVVENGTLVELIYEKKNSLPIVGNVYAGKIMNVLPGMQACFVDIGREKNAFLYYGDDKDNNGNIVKPKMGSDVIVQVEKAEMGAKGAVLTKRISFAGKFLVVIPGDDKIGISKKITDSVERKRIKDIIEQLLPENYGIIVRTEGKDKSYEIYEKEIKRLVEKSEGVLSKAEYAKAPSLLYTEINGVEKVLRDLYNENIDEIVVNSCIDYETLIKLCEEKDISPKKIVMYESDVPMFENYYVASQAKAAFSKHVWLKSGGFIIIEQTEACVVIDVNTGKYTGKADLQKTILKTNLEAADEIARQLRLRNLNGMIIVDFIDMKTEENRKILQKHLEEAVAKDRLQTIVVGMTELGLMQITRKKKRQSIQQLMTRSCHCCGGSGREPIYEDFKG